MSSTLLIERQGAIETWTMNDPATRNALSDAVVDALLQACARAAQDATLRIVVLTGAGGAFCAGGSLGGFANLIGQPLQEGQSDPLLAMNKSFGDLLHALCALPQLLVCRVDGAAMGGGFGLVCCADHVVATARSVLGTPEVTLGLPPAQIAPFVWQRLGESAARQCLLQGLSYNATQAMQVGLVNEVIEHNSDAAWQVTLTRLLRAAPGAVASTKQLLRNLRSPVPDLRDAAAQAFAQGLRSTEAAQGLTAFARKQPAPWTLSGKDTA
ncbi:enoyl-CoA hydratase/isomerase family protein [Limnohabitans sp. Bal53]|uniref:enoyl-CoA hydratase/isomerase family protein n=1 Tax=Limnohabitans sp. Bal53 TaxID=1977910 RepID=UPI000D374C53|nr:enoyl-CoA hydratase-related protein [Limnohabitans sp. Bal53]PUE39804.1 enoyl-CoA hydratase [Limnohabitans sp. Bal53]